MPLRRAGLLLFGLLSTLVSSAVSEYDLSIRCVGFFFRSSAFSASSFAVPHFPFPDHQAASSNTQDQPATAPTVPPAQHSSVVDLLRPYPRPVLRLTGDHLPGTEIRKQSGLPTLTYIGSTAIGVLTRGRYRLDRVLGEGAFGRVYLGFDEELQRQVAIKVPTKARFRKREDAEAYLAEARTVASLDHPHIVPVYDMGRTQDGSIYVVSKFIEGSTLEDRIKAGRQPEREVVQLLATVAMALQHAHQQRLVHRDIKPANILLEEKSNTPYVADFGLAIREEDYLKENAIAGTPAYMSPEQVRGEGHRLDGRSDVFSMGVIFYEMLTGKRPFRGSNTQETLYLVVSSEPQPPREQLATIPAELERICLKAIAKRASARYTSAKEFADDLEQWLKRPSLDDATSSPPVIIVPTSIRPAKFSRNSQGAFKWKSSLIATVVAMCLVATFIVVLYTAGRSPESARSTVVTAASGSVRLSRQPARLYAANVAYLLPAILLQTPESLRWAASLSPIFQSAYGPLDESDIKSLVVQREMSRYSQQFPVIESVVGVGCLL